MAEVSHNARAQLNCVQVRAPAKNTDCRNRRLRAVVFMHPAVVCLEQAKAEAVVEERNVVVHAAADCQSGSPSVGFVLKRRRNFAVRSAKTSSADQSVGKHCEVFHGEATDQTAGDSRHAIVRAVRMVAVDNLAAEVLVEVVRTTTDRTIVDGGVRQAVRHDTAMCAEVANTP